MKHTATDILVLQEIEQLGEVRLSDIYEPFTRKRNSCEKLTKAGLLKKREAGFQYATYYSKA